LQIILIQVKGGGAAKPTADDARRLRIIARRHTACGILLAAWKKGSAARFFSLHIDSRRGGKVGVAQDHDPTLANAVHDRYILGGLDRLRELPR
jgi:hypothetical protein